MITLLDKNGKPLNNNIIDNIYGNSRIIRYPDGTLLCYLSDRAIFRDRGWVEVGNMHKDVAERSICRQEDSEARSARRARNQIRDICWCTTFRWFVTFTLNREKIDRYDIDAIYKKLKIWLDNNVRRRGLAYVIVPEYHADGALHFHGLINRALDEAMQDSGHRDRQGRPIYNLTSWELGYTTAVRLDADYHRAVGYVIKYVTKQHRREDQPLDPKRRGKIGGRWYYSGGALWDLGRPTVAVTQTDQTIQQQVARDIAEGAYNQRYKLDDIKAELLISEYRIDDNGVVTAARAPKTVPATDQYSDSVEWIPPELPDGYEQIDIFT